MANKFLKKENLGKLIDTLTSEGSVFIAPKMGARQVVYAPVANVEEIIFDYIIPFFLILFGHNTLHRCLTIYFIARCWQ